MKPLKYTRTADIIAKVSCVVAFVFMILYLFIEILYGLGYITTGVVRIVCLILWFVPGFIVLIYPFLFDDDTEDFEPKIKPDKMAIDISSFEDFFNQAEISIVKNGLTKIANESHENYEFYLYATPRKITSMDFVLIINTDEITNEILNHSSRAYVESIQSYYQKKLKNLSSNVNVITVVCVKRITPVLRRVLSGNAGLEQDFSMGRFISAISFGGKNLYMIKQKGLIGKAKYKKCKDKFKAYFDFLFPHNVSE